MAEDYAQIQPDSTGALVRTVRVTTLVDGVPTEVEMQVVGIADAEGRPVAFPGDAEWRDEVLAELRAIRLGMEHQCGGTLRDG